MVRRWLRRLLTGAMLLAAMPAAAEVEISIDRNPVQVNESFQVVFSLDHSPDREPDFSPLQQHFMILNTSRTNSISIINGEYQRSVKWTLQLMAKQAGEFMLPAIRFDQERSQPFAVTVEPSSLASVPHDRLVFELLADQTEAPVQSQVILRLRLLSADSISAYQFGDILLDGVDAVLEPLGDVRQYQTRIADRHYLVLEKQYALFPQQSGRIEIAPVMAEVRLPSRQKYDPFQSGGKIRSVRSQPLAIDVMPIPPEFDQPFWLPATRVELREDWPGDRERLVAGEPVTRSLTLIAEGLTSAQLPELALPAVDGIKQYPDQPALDDSITGKGITGRRMQKVALIPGAAGRYRLPEIRVPWWNLESGRLEWAVIPARDLDVIAPAATHTAPPAADGLPTAAPAPAAVSSRFWPYASLLLALGWAASALYWWLRGRRRAAPAQAEESRSLRQARKRLQQACRDNDAAAARRALLAWGQALLAPREVHHLRQLTEYLGAELGAEIARLDRSLYASAPRPWEGDSLSRLVARLERESRADGGGDADSLLPLNPAP